MSLLNSILGGNDLPHEKHKARLKGPAADIARLRKLDKAIGSLIAPFNGVARVPDEVTAKIDTLVKAHQDSFARVAATRPYSENLIETLGSKFRGAAQVTEQPLDWLEYEISYRSRNGNRIEQRVAQVRVGPY